eukprot:656522-Prymnesium_polylepis.1
MLKCSGRTVCDGESPRGRRADTRTSVATQARTGQRATWTAQGDYPLVSPLNDASLVPERTAERA